MSGRPPRQEDGEGAELRRKEELSRRVSGGGPAGPCAGVRAEARAAPGACRLGCVQREEEEGG